MRTAPCVLKLRASDELFANPVSRNKTDNGTPPSASDDRVISGISSGMSPALNLFPALVEGWVDHVTGLATARLPKSGALGEAIRRRRASGGPAEHAFSTLVGLELRPRKLREASALWAEIHRELGSEARDELWRHPDTLPHLDDLDNPRGFLQRIAHPPADDDFDQALRELLDEETPES